MPAFVCSCSCHKHLLMLTRMIANSFWRQNVTKTNVHVIFGAESSAHSRLLILRNGGYFWRQKRRNHLSSLRCESQVKGERYVALHASSKCCVTSNNRRCRHMFSVMSMAQSSQCFFYERKSARALAPKNVWISGSRCIIHAYVRDKLLAPKCVFLRVHANRSARYDTLAFWRQTAPSLA